MSGFTANIRKIKNYMKMQEFQKKLNSPYAITKIISEEILRRKNNFPVTILRLGIVYGLRKKYNRQSKKYGKEVKKIKLTLVLKKQQEDIFMFKM